MAIAEVSADGELLRGTVGEDDVRGRNLNALDARIGFLRAGCAGSDPVGEDFIFERIDFETFAAFVRDGRGGFQQEETAPWISGINATALRLPGERDVVAFIIITAERKAEPILSGRGPMAGAGVATGFGEDRLDVVAERDLFRRGGRRDYE